MQDADPVLPCGVLQAGLAGARKLHLHPVLRLRDACLQLNIHSKEFIIDICRRSRRRLLYSLYRNADFLSSLRSTSNSAEFLCPLENGLHVCHGFMQYVTCTMQPHHHIQALGFRINKYPTGCGLLISFLNCPVRLKPSASSCANLISQLLCAAETISLQLCQCRVLYTSEVATRRGLSKKSAMLQE